MEALCESLPVLVSNEVVEGQLQTEYAVRAFTDNLRLQDTMKTKDAVFVATEGNWDKKKAVYDKKGAKHGHQVIDKFKDLSKQMEPTSTVSYLVPKLAPF